MPRGYLTTFAEVLEMRTNPAAPIWYSTVSGKRTPLLYDAQGCRMSLPAQAPWRKLTLDCRSRDGAERIGVITPELLASLAQGKQKAIPVDQPIDSAAAITLLIKPREKRILDEVADHPLLAEDEIALMLRLAVWQVREGLKTLSKLGLVEGHTIKGEQVSESGANVPSPGSTVTTNAQEPERKKKRSLCRKKGCVILG